MGRSWRKDEAIARNLSVPARREIISSLLQYGLSVREVAGVLGVSRQAVWHYRQDDFQMSNSTALRGLSRLFKLDLMRILALDVEKYVQDTSDYTLRNLGPALGDFLLRRAQQLEDQRDRDLARRLALEEMRRKLEEMEIAIREAISALERVLSVIRVHRPPTLITVHG